MELKVRKAALEVKKVKISRTIVDQAIVLGFNEILKYEVVGWYVDRGIKMILFYDSKNYLIYKHKLFTIKNIVCITEDNARSFLKSVQKETKITQEHIDDVLGNYYILYQYDDALDIECSDSLLDKNFIEDYHNKLKVLITEVFDKGQFYL